MRRAEAAGDLGGLDRAPFPPPVSTPTDRRRHGNLVPGQYLRQTSESYLIILHGEHVVPTTPDEVLGGGPMTMQGIRGHDYVGEVERGEQVCDQRGLAGVHTDLDLPEYHPLAWPGGEQMGEVPGRGRRTAQGLPSTAITRRPSARDVEPGQRVLRCIGGPFSDRDERPRTSTLWTVPPTGTR